MHIGSVKYAALSGILAFAMAGAAHAQTAEAAPPPDAQAPARGSAADTQTSATTANTGQPNSSGTLSGSGQNGLQDIVVTAQRTRQRLQDVPVSVTAVTSADIDRRQIQTMLDVSAAAPNVKFDTVTGGTSGLRAYIRGGGITDAGYVLSESEVAIYVDDVYQARQSASLIDFAVLDRIEVLRGPQGVLYGRNSSAGAVNIITRAPAAQFTGLIEGGYGSFNERRLKAYVSTPLSRDGAWRFSVNGLVRARDGGAQYNVTTNKKVGSNSFEGGQADLSYVGNVINARLTGFYLHSNSDGQYAVNTTKDASGNIVPITGSYRRVASPDPSFGHTKQYGARLHLSADYGSGRLTSITGYSHLSEGWGEDFSGGVPASFLGIAGGGTLDLFYRTLIDTQHQFSEELQAAGKINGNLFEYVAGLYYFTESANQTQNSRIFFAPSTSVYIPTTHSYAAYAQGTLNITDRLALIAAGRYTSDHKSLTGSVGATPVSVRNTYSKFTPKLGVNFKINPNVLTYVSYSQGFKAGGYNGLASTAAQLATPFKPQVTTTYEAGFKSDLLGRRLRFNAAAFINKIKDRQQTVNLGNGGFLIENYNVEMKGIEAEISARVTRGLTLFVNGSVNEGHYTGTSSAVASILHNKLPVLPKTEFTVGFDYDVPIGPGHVTLGSDFNHREGYYSTPDNAPVGLVQPQDILNAYAGYEVGRWKLLVSGKNLLQQHGWQTGFGFSVVNPRFSIEPRTWLATVRYTF